MLDGAIDHYTPIAVGGANCSGVHWLERGDDASQLSQNNLNPRVLNTSI